MESRPTYTTPVARASTPASLHGGYGKPPTYTTPVARASIPARLHGGYGKPPYICDTRSAGFHTRAPARRLWKAALHIRHPLHGLPHPRTAAMESRPTPYYIPLHGLPYPRACTAAMESRPTYTTPVARASTPAHGAYGKPPYIYDTRCTGSHTHCTAAMESRPTYTTPVARVPIPTARRLWKAALPHITSRSAGFHTHAPARRLWKAALLLTSGEGALGPRCPESTLRGRRCGFPPACAPGSGPPPHGHPGRAAPDRIAPRGVPPRRAGRRR